MSTTAAALEHEPILLREDADGVTALTLNRPQQFNALSEAMLETLQATLDEIAVDNSVRVVVLAAKGRAYCAGHDLKEMRSQPAQAYYQKLFAQCSQMMLSLVRLPQPVIAQVQGIATAAGCQLVGTCDLAVAADTARFAVSGVNLGLFCSTPSVALSRNVARKKAFEMLATGDFIDAPTAVEYGLINRAVPADELDTAVAELAASILKKPATALAMGKKLFYSQLEDGLEGAYEQAASVMACNMMDPDAAEGIDAFIEKRPPSWGQG